MKKLVLIIRIIWTAVKVPFDVKKLLSEIREASVMPSGRAVGKTGYGSGSSSSEAGSYFNTRYQISFLSHHLFFQYQAIVMARITTSTRRFII